VQSISPFSATGVEDVDGMLREVRTLLANPDWKIKDILPCMPLQVPAVEATVSDPKFSVQYNLVYLDKSLDTDKVLRHCRELVDHHEILRTVFVQYRDSWRQVILEAAEIDICRHEVDSASEEDLATTVGRICHQDCSGPIRAGEMFFKCMLIRDSREGAQQDCLVFRISHAQYDGVTLPRLFLQLAELYDGASLPRTKQFSDYVYHCVTQAIPRSYEFWRELLKGSSGISAVMPADERSSTPFSATKTLDMSGRNRDFTFSTTVTAAWAYVLASHLAARDVVFGQVVSARTTGLVEGDAVMGNCYNHVPVRVPFRRGWTGADLLQFVQDQQLAKTPWVATGLADIVRECTDGWPAEASTAPFDSRVLHDDIDYFESISMGGLACRIDALNPHKRPAKEWLIQSYAKDDVLSVEILCSETFKSLAEKLLGRLVETIEALGRRPDGLVFF